MKVFTVLVLLLFSGCSTAFLIDKRECSEVGPDHFQCPEKAVMKLK